MATTPICETKSLGFHQGPHRFKRLRVQDDVSLNDNTNVRNCLNENIYTPGVLRLEMEGGGVSGKVWDVWI